MVVPSREKYRGDTGTRTLTVWPSKAHTFRMDRTEISTLVCVQCDIELLRRGIERAATRAGLLITDQEADATFVVRHGKTDARASTAQAAVTVTEVAILIAATSAIDPSAWAAVGRLANALLGHVDR